MLAFAGQSWTEAEPDEVTALYVSEVADQPIPFMGPPVLEDHETGLWLSQLPAIATYLGEQLGLMPGNPQQDALTGKVICDSIDVLHALTLNCGMQMWTDDAWQDFTSERLPRWLCLFEDLGSRNGLSLDAGTLLGTAEPCAADLTCAALWISITDTLPGLEPLITTYAPKVYSLSRRIAGVESIHRLRADQQQRWGNVWCEGQIEQSLRAVLAAWQFTGR